MGLIYRILDRALIFQKSSIEEFTKRLTKLAEDLGTFKMAVEYI